MPQKKLIKFYDDKLSALEALGADKHMTLQELADEAFADLLNKHERPSSLKDALRQSARRIGANDNPRRGRRAK